ncbi:MAG: two-component system, LytTR family, response regulator [Pyrinomonadaceae bacterium]|nr:two-component system, LytTR family, response regulator [Pyrinomonadaceae bacterium]MDQ1593393.1 two-component system, LytTR family, response regulator [Pyrinomonadaceae bacterium]MDX6272374.1 two-component system, LytTR family, response regulator [Acidobacteriota bacterium]
MNTIRTLIVDDEPLARERIKRFLADERDLELVGECAAGREAVAAIHALRPDLVFLDIQIPELDGFGVVKAVGVAEMPAVIFVTAYDRYALQAFDVNALDYLLKPYNHERFRKAVERARAQLSNGAKGELNERLLSLLENFKTEPTRHLERLMIKSSGRVFFLRADELDWIEAEGNYLRLHAGKESHLLRETMNRLASKLDPDKFLRIHRSTLVNIERIKELQPLFSGDYVVILRDGKQLTLSRSYRDKLLELFENSS